MLRFKPSTIRTKNINLLVVGGYISSHREVFIPSILELYKIESKYPPSQRLTLVGGWDGGLAAGGQFSTSHKPTYQILASD